MRIFVPEDLGDNPIPAAVYIAQITGVKHQMSKGDPSQGKEPKNMLNVEYTIQSESPDPAFKTLGRKVFDNLVIYDTSLFKANDLFKAITGSNIPSKDWEMDELLSALTSAFNGATVLLSVDIETYEGKERNKVKKVSPYKVA